MSPEKAIKLTANDTMRDLLTSEDGSLALWKECIAGGCVSYGSDLSEVFHLRMLVVWSNIKNV